MIIHSSRHVQCVVLATAASLVGCGGGGSDKTEPELTTLQRAAALLAQLDASLANSAPSTPEELSTFSDPCYLSNGSTKATLQAKFDENPDRSQGSETYRIGSKRSNLKILAERDSTNADGSTRKEVDITYSISYADGSTEEVDRLTLISGSSFGSCDKPENSTNMRFLGNRKIVGVALISRNIRDQRTLISNGQPASPAITYRRDIQFAVWDPQGLATYAIVTGPGPSNTIEGVTHEFSLKLLSPRILRSNPLLAGKSDNYLNWGDYNFFRACRLPSSITGVPVIAHADCAGEGTQGQTWGWTKNDPTPNNVAEADTGFNNLGFAKGGAYTFKIYADEGWKTKNGHEGKTAIAEYTIQLNNLPYTFAEMIGEGVQVDKFARLISVSPSSSDLASIVKSGSSSQINATWTAPTITNDGRVFALGEAYEYFQGAAASNQDNIQYPGYRYYNPVFPGGKATSISGEFIEAKPAEIKSKNYSEFGLNYTDRKGGHMISYYSFR